MSERKAKALYDYSPSSAEDIQFFADEILIILDINISEGWSRGRNARDEEGIIPSSYYELIRPFETESLTVDNESDTSSFDSDYSEPVPTENRKRLDSPILLSVSSSRRMSSVKMPNSFLKGGGQNFLFGKKSVAGDIEAEVEVLKEGIFEIYQWKQFGNRHTCNIDSYKVDSKYKGIKTFVNYEITSSYSTKKVMHRYNQFDWLYSQFAEKYPCIVVPPLPGRQVAGRFKSEFIESRKVLLQHWLNHITEHPVLSNSYAIKMFFSESDKKKWKIAKLKVKNDVFKNGGFYNAVKAPTDILDIPKISERLKKVAWFIDDYYRNSCCLSDGFRRFHKYQNEGMLKEHSKISKRFLDITESLAKNPDQNQDGQDLTQGLNKIGNAYQEIGVLFESQAKIDSSFVEPNLGEMNGITKEIPSILELSNGALNTLNSCINMSSESKLDEETIKNVDRGVQLVTRTVDAELSWLQNRRQHQMRSVMCQHLKNQIELFTQITAILSDTLKNFDV